MDKNNAAIFWAGKRENDDHEWDTNPIPPPPQAFRE